MLQSQDPFSSLHDLHAQLRLMFTDVAKAHGSVSWAYPIMILPGTSYHSDSNTPLDTNTDSFGPLGAQEPAF